MKFLVSIGKYDRQFNISKRLHCLRKKLLSLIPFFNVFLTESDPRTEQYKFVCNFFTTAGTQ